MNKFNSLILILLFAFLIFLFSFIQNRPLYDDEPGSYDQIKIYLNRRWEISEGFSKFPGFPFAIANLSLLINKTDISNLRAINFLFALASIVIFYLINLELDAENGVIKTVMFAFLPVLFPYQFLLYTENISNFTLLLAFYLTVRKKFFASGIFSIISVSVRQINIIWLVFIFFYIYLNNTKQYLNIGNFISHCRKNWLFLLTCFLFLIFGLVNKGFAVGNLSGAHPSFTIYPGNVYWLLFLFFVLFLPQNIYNISSFFLFLKKNKKLLYPILFFIIVSALTFNNSHPWNQYPEHLRNRILILFNSYYLNKLIFFIIISYSLLSLSQIKLINKVLYLIYPFSFLSLAPMWLIESRYSIIPLFLFILFKKKTNTVLEIITSFIFFCLSLLFYFVYLSQKFYL